MWNILKDFIDYLKKEFPFLWAIIAMFLWWIEKNWNNKKEKSTSNLINFIKNKEKSPLDKIEQNKKIDLKSKQLKKFYKYLDSEWIKYWDKKYEFWEEFLTWTNKDWNNIDKKTAKLRELFLENLNWESLENLDLAKFTKTLNSLPEIAKKKEKAEINKHNTEIKQKIEKAKKSWNTEKIKKLEKQIKHSFEENLLRWKVEVNWELKDISIENNKFIKIGENKYSISVKAIWNEYFESISLNNWEIIVTANWESKKYGISQVKPILNELITNWKVIKKIPKWFITATVTIEKV